MRPFQTEAYMLGAEDGYTLPATGVQVCVKAACEQTAGAFNLFELACPPGYATPLHIHYAEAVAVYVLSGTLDFFWGGEKKQAAAGSFFFQPQGTPHGFRVHGGAPARILYMTFPAGLDGLLAEAQLRGADLEPATAAARYKIEILGPLPE